jgi:hypothetical protein
MKKEIKKNSSIFNPDMYVNTLGSVIICGYILSENKPDPVEINKTWRKLKKNPEKYIDFWLDDSSFIDKSLALFNMTRPENFPIAMVQSKYNVLFMPYFDGQLYPLNEKGIYPQTAKSGKIYPIDFTNKSEDTTNSVQKIDLEKKE